MLALFVNVGFIFLVGYGIYLINRKRKRNRVMRHVDQTKEELEAEQNVTREKAKSWRIPPGGGNM